MKTERVSERALNKLNTWAKTMNVSTVLRAYSTPLGRDAQYSQSETPAIAKDTKIILNSIPESIILASGDRGRWCIKSVSAGSIVKAMEVAPSVTRLSQRICTAISGSGQPNIKARIIIATSPKLVEVR